MEIAGSVVLAVLFGALLHASWNALIKSSSDKSLDTALIHALGAVLALPLLAYAGWPDAAAWPFIAATTVIHLAYYATLAAAYRHGDLGLTYPIMRGSAPLLVALLSPIVMGESLSLTAWMGILLVCACVLLLGLSATSVNRTERHKALGFALLNALIIAVYTMVDGIGVRVSGSALSYVAVLFLFDAFPYMALVMWRKTPQQRQSAWMYMRARWPIALLGTLASVSSYGIALWAMTHAPVAVVAALRETSVLFAVVLGCVFLREPMGWRKAMGAMGIVGGVWLLRWV